MYRERKAPISAVHDTHRGVCPEQTSLHLEDAAVTTGILSHVLDSVSNMEKLTFLHLDGLMGSWDLPVLSFLPHLETLDKIAINNDDTMSSASGRLRALCFSSKLKTLAVDFTGTNKTCVALFTSQLFAHALQLQSASFSSEKVTRFVTPSQQPNYNVTDLRLLHCVCLDDKGLIDTTLCFPALTDLAVGSPCVTAAGLGRITKLTRLQNLDIEGCSFIKAAVLKDLVANMHHLSVLRLAPHVAKDLYKHKKRFRKTLLIDDRVCRQVSFILFAHPCCFWIVRFVSVCSIIETTCSEVYLYAIYSPGLIFLWQCMYVC
ncbi:TPA: hypothetical protein ACH3X1_009578 [Trebouxia sp. C0004]